MTDDRPTEASDDEGRAEFDWRSPRWREADEVQGDVERARRFKGNVEPRQRGAIDENLSVDGAPGAGTKPDRRADGDTTPDDR